MSIADDTVKYLRENSQMQTQATEYALKRLPDLHRRALSGERELSLMNDDAEHPDLKSRRFNTYGFKVFSGKVRPARD